MSIENTRQALSLTNFSLSSPQQDIFQERDDLIFEKREEIKEQYIGEQFSPYTKTDAFVATMDTYGIVNNIIQATNLASDNKPEEGFDAYKTVTSDPYFKDYTLEQKLHVAENALNLDNMKKRADRFDRINLNNEIMEDHSTLSTSLMMGNAVIEAFALTPTGLAPSVHAIAKSANAVRTQRAVEAAQSTFGARLVSGTAEEVAILAVYDAANQTQTNEAWALIGGAFNGFLGKVNYAKPETSTHISPTGVVTENSSVVRNTDEANLQAPYSTEEAKDALVRATNNIHVANANPTNANVTRAATVKAASLDQSLQAKQALLKKDAETVESLTFTIEQTKKEIESVKRTIDDSEKGKAFTKEELAKLKEQDDYIKALLNDREIVRQRMLDNPDMDPNFDGIPVALKDEKTPLVALETEMEAIKKEIANLLPKGTKPSKLPKTLKGLTKKLNDFNVLTKENEQLIKKLLNYDTIVKQVKREEKLGRAKLNATQVQVKKLNTAEKKLKKVQNRILGVNKDYATTTKNLKEVTEILDNIKVRKPDEPFDISRQAYAAFKSTSTRTGELPTALHTYNGNSLTRVRDGAVEAGDDDVIKLIDDLNITNADGTVKKFKDLSEIEKTHLRTNTAAQPNKYGRLDKILQGVGQRLTQTSSDIFNGITDKLITGTQGAKKGQATTASAMDHKERYIREFETRSVSILRTHTEKWIEAEGKRNNALKRAHSSFSNDYNLFSNLTGKYMLELSSNPAARARTHPDVIKAGDELLALQKEQLERLQQKGWVDAEDLTIMEGSYSRVRNDESYLAAEKAFTKEELTSVHEGALVKADPTMSLRFKLDRAKADKETPKSYIANLEAQISTLNARYRDTPITDAEVKDIIRLSGEDSYSRMLADLMYGNQLERAKGRSPIDKASFNGQDILDALSSISPELRSSLGEDNMDLLQAYLLNGKKGDGAGANMFKPRLDLDTSFTVTLRNQEDIEYDVNMSSFYETDASVVTLKTINNFSSMDGLASVGVRSWDEYEEVLKTAHKQTDHMLAKEQKAARSDLDVLDNALRNRAQFNEGGTRGYVRRTLKALSASSSLGYLAFALPVELSNVISANGIKAAVRQFPNVNKAISDILTGKETTQGLVRDLNLAGANTMQPIYNAKVSMDNGIVTNIGSKNNGKFGVDKNSLSTRTDRVLSKIQDTSMLIADVSAKTYKWLDLYIRRLSTASTMQRLMDLYQSDPTKLMSQRFKDAGMSQEMMDALPFIHKHMTYDGVSGGITGINWQAMRKENLDLAERFIVMVNNLGDRQVTTVRVGNLPAFVNTEMYSWLGQFQSFALATYNIQFKYNIAKGDAQAAALFAVQTVVGALGTAARDHTKATLTGDDQYIKDKDIAYYLLSGVRASGSLSLGSKMLDTATGVTIGQEFFSGGSVRRSRGNLLDFRSYAVGNQATEMIQFLEELSGNLRGEGDFDTDWFIKSSGLFMPNILVDAVKGTQ